MELVFGTKASLCYKETCLSVVDLMLWCSCGKKKRERFSVTMWQAAQEIYRDGEHCTVNIRCSTKTSSDWSPSPCIWPTTARRRSRCLAATFSISGLSPIWLWTNPLYFATLASFPGTYFLRQCQKYRILNNSMHYGVSDIIHRPYRPLSAERKWWSQRPLGPVLIQCRIKVGAIDAAALGPFNK